MSTKLEFRQMDQLIDPNYDPYKNQKKTKNQEDLEELFASVTQLNEI